MIDTIDFSCWRFNVIKVNIFILLSIIKSSFSFDLRISNSRFQNHFNWRRIRRISIIIKLCIWHRTCRFPQHIKWRGRLFRSIWSLPSQTFIKFFYKNEKFSYFKIFRDDTQASDNFSKHDLKSVDSFIIINCRFIHLLRIFQWRILEKFLWRLIIYEWSGHWGSFWRDLKWLRTMWFLHVFLIAVLCELTRFFVLLAH